MSETVTTWLEGLGLGQYAEAFEENAVGLEHLPDLDHAVLQSIGEKAAGHRMTLLRAAATLDGNATGPEEPQKSAGEAERRQLTVMFCDLAGSVELGERMDVEDYRDLLGQYRRVVVEAIGRYDGFVARHQGDGLMAYFGYPEARENDAERAVRAGVEAVRAIETLDHPYDAELAMRVGIATGEAVVGDVLDTGTSRELAAFGPTPNLAARLQGEAAPNSVLMSQMTHRLVSTLFDSQPIGPLSLKRIGPGVLAFRLQGDSEVRTPSQVASAAQLSPLVGRDLEVRLLLERWQQACDGEGQAVLLSGDPGVGKTRITRAFQSELKNTSLSRILMYCSPFHRNATLYPLRDQMERAMRFEVSDDVSTKSMKMHGVLAQLGLEGEVNAAVLRRLLLLPDDGGEAATLTPEQLRHRALETLTSIVGAMTRQRPVLMVVEDLHWLDPSTETWLGHILEAAGHWRLLLVLTARPEYAVPWARPPHMTELALNHLSRRDCAQLVQVVAADHGLAASTVEPETAGSSAIICARISAL